MGAIRDRLTAFDVNEILPLIGKGQSMMYGEHKINLHSLRLHTFKHTGCICVRCGIIGTLFVAERDKWHGRKLGERANSSRPTMLYERLPNGGPYHINLYGFTPDGKERLMTKDHIKAKSRGGRDELSNMQTMCENCNRKKGSFDDWDIVDLHWTNYLPDYTVKEK